MDVALLIKDLLELEDAALRALLRSFGPDPRTIRVETAHSLAAVAWRLRLPATGEQLRAMLRAHDFKDAWPSDFCALFDFGMSLLITTHGPLLAQPTPSAEDRFLALTARS